MVPSVTAHDQAGIGIAVRHLVELGHRRIAHVAGSQAVTTGLMRYRAFMSWARGERLAYDPDLVVFADPVAIRLTPDLIVRTSTSGPPSS